MTPNLRVLVLGVSGLIGHQVFLRLKQDFVQTWGTLREPVGHPFLTTLLEAGFRNLLPGVELSFLPNLIRDLHPDVVVNTIGLGKQHGDSRSELNHTNWYLPLRLAHVCSQINARLIHLSTDAVFSGAPPHLPYVETDGSFAGDSWAESKRLGEVHWAPHLTLRAACIGRELKRGHGLLEWFLCQPAGLNISIHQNVWWTAVTARELAEIVRRSLDVAIHGVYHVAGPWESKGNLLTRIQVLWQRPVILTPQEEPRWDYSLNGERLIRAIGYQSPGWEEMLSELYEDPFPYDLFYSFLPQEDPVVPP